MEIAEGIWVVENFFTAEECKEWIELAEDVGFGEAPISVSRGKEEVRKDIRNNSRAMVDDDERTFLLWQKAKPHVPQMLYGRVAVGLNERLRFYRYDNSQKFSWHHDGSFMRESGERSFLTFMIYLNEGYSGGETLFNNSQETVIKPKTGMLLLFKHEILHEGSEIKSGRKYVLRSDVMFSK